MQKETGLIKLKRTRLPHDHPSTPAKHCTASRHTQPQPFELDNMRLITIMSVGIYGLMRAGEL